MSQQTTCLQDRHNGFVPNSPILPENAKKKKKKKKAKKTHDTTSTNL